MKKLAYGIYGLTIALMASGCAMTPKQATTEARTPASRGTIELNASNGGPEVIQYLKKASPPLPIKKDRIQTGQVYCTQSMETACVFLLNPAEPSRITDRDAEAFQQLVWKWQRSLDPKNGVMDTEVKNIECDGKGNCLITIGGTGHGV
jgi:hypothetical protein